MGFFDFLPRAKKKLTDTVGGLGAVANTFRSQIGNDISSGVQGVKNYLNSPASPGAVDFSNRLQDQTNKLVDFQANFPKFSFAEKSRTPVGRFALSIPESALNIPSKIFQNVGKTERDIKSGAIYKPTGVMNFLGRTGENALDVVTLGKGKAAVSAGKEILDQGAPRILPLIKEGWKEGTKLGTKYGAGYGFFGGAQKEDPNAVSLAKDTAIGAGAGRYLGGALGAAAPVVGALPGAVKNSVKNFMKAPKTETIPAHDVLGKIDYFQQGTPKSYNPVHIPEQTVVRKAAPTVSDLFRGVKEALPQPGMGIKDVSGRKAPLIPKHEDIIAAKNERSRQIVGNQQENQRTGLPKAEPGFVPPETVKAPQVVKSAGETASERFSRELDAIPTPWAKKELPAVPNTPASDPMPANIRSIKDNVDNGVLVGPNAFAKLRQWEEKQAKKAADPLGMQTGPFNKYQEDAFQKKGERIQAIKEVTDAPTILRAMGFTKKEASKLGVEEARITAELGKLGYPKDDPILRDVRSETVTRILENKVPHKTLKEYYTKKHELDTKILEGVDPKTLKDISPLQAGTRDMYRNFETVFGDGKYDNPTFQKVKKELLDPFDASKGDFIAEQKIQLAALDEHIVNGLGIKKGSDESAAVQMFGEGKLTLDQLKEKFPKKWENIVKANEWFRNMYDNMLDETNRIREYFNPTHPLFPESTKVIPKRANYYRHFQEMADGFQGLRNIFDTPANIDPSLAVSSEFTKPKTKWLSFAQQRKGDQTTFDAVGGFLDYIKANAYAKHIDPHIQRFRGVDAELKSKVPRGEFFNDTQIGLAEELSKKIDPFQQIAETSSVAKLKNLLIEKGLTDRDALKMGKDLSGIKDAAGVKNYLEKNLTPEGMNEFKARALAEDSGNKLNNFLKFLDNFSGDLAGKTNTLDRPIQDNFFGRQTFRAINWINSRVKANVILGNLGSALAQPFSIPSGIANAGARNSAKAVGPSLLGIFKNDVPSAKSDFLNERYFNGYDKFDPGVIANTKRFAIWITSIGDKIGSTFTWNAQYQKALTEGITDPTKYADDWTRRMVAGRGIGEVPIMQKSKIVQILAPFQLEVANQWRVFGDWARNDPSKLAVAKKLMEYSVAVWVMNRVVKEIRGSDVAFDPIQAMADAYQSFQEADSAGEGTLLAGGRVAGEVLSNMPGGSTAAAFFPEFGAQDVLGSGVNIPTREKIFGDKDPTRFGNGIMAGRAFLEPQYMLVPPFGGRQIKNTYDGAKTLLNGYAETNAGKVMTPVTPDVTNVMKGVLFGKNALNEVQNYREADSNPLGEKQGEIFRMLPKTERLSLFDSTMNSRAANKEKETLKKATVSGDMSGATGEIGDGMYRLKDGNIYVPGLLSETKTFKTEKLAKYAIDREDFMNSEDKTREHEGNFWYKDANGDFKTKTVSARQRDLDKAKSNLEMDRAQARDDMTAWMGAANKKIQAIETYGNTLDPAIDQDEIDSLTLERENLIAKVEKFDEQGGFKKGSAGKKLPVEFRYPLVDPEMLKIQRLIAGTAGRKFRMVKNLLPLVRRRPPIVHRTKRK